jgi:hypothetical protein
MLNVTSALHRYFVSDGGAMLIAWLDGKVTDAEIESGLSASSLCSVSVFVPVNLLSACIYSLSIVLLTLIHKIPVKDGFNRNFMDERQKDDGK